MKTILAIDSFKGCMSSSEVEETIAGVLNKMVWRRCACPCLTAEKECSKRSLLP